MIYFAPAKINIGLNIIRRRDDGFHDIETVFYPVPLFDIVDIVASQNKSVDFAYSQSGLDITIPLESNLCYKAYQLIKKEFKIPPIQIHLHKSIPDGAGLGGGSSDASAVIILLNKLFQLNQSPSKMEAMAQKIGSDCPFFVLRKPVFAQGRGEIFTHTRIDLSGKKLVLIKPPIHINTKEAYSGIVPRGQSVNLANKITVPVDMWKVEIENDFEKSVFKKIKLLHDIKLDLYARGAIYASMSGSGSCIYGIFSGEDFEISNYPQDYFVWEGIL